MSPIGFRAFPSREPLEPASLEIGKWRTCDISDALLGAGTMRGVSAVYGPVPRVVGPAVTVSLPIPNFDVLKLGLSYCRPGDVLVVGACGNVDVAIFGGSLGTAAKNRGLAGIVVDGAIRDVEELREAGFPAFAAGTATTAAALSAGYGEINVPVACGSVVVKPGDIVIGDDDGVQVVSPEDVQEAIAAVSALDAHYQTLEPIVARGDIVGIQQITERLKAQGLETT